MMAALAQNVSITESARVIVDYATQDLPKRTFVVAQTLSELLPTNRASGLAAQLLMFVTPIPSLSVPESDGAPRPSKRRKKK